MDPNAWYARLIAALLVALPCTPAVASGQTWETDSAWLASKGFQQRAPDALLHAGRDSIRAVRGRSIEEVLTDLPQIRLGQGSGSDRPFLMTDEAGQGTGCVLLVYLNGARVYGPGAGPATARAVERAVRLRDLDAIEVHSAETSPVGGEDSCGSALLWSRRMSRDVDVEFTGWLRGRSFRGGTDRPTGDVEITLEPGGHRQTTDSGGWFDFGAVPPGRYRITARTQDGAVWSGILVLKAFAISQVEIEVRGTEEIGSW